MPTLFNRFAGGLIGQCLGDALGFPLEGDSPPKKSCLGSVSILAEDC